MIARLYDYFGILGCASIAVWGAAVFVLIGYARTRRRNWFYLGALALAILGLALAKANSRAVSAIPLDRSEEVAAATAAVEEPAKPAYLQGAKVQRRPAAAAPAAPVVRTLKEPQLVEANRWDRLNLFAARLTLCVAVLLVIWDYFARFNSTFDRWLPLPIAGPWLDAMFPKEMQVILPRTRAAELKPFMDLVLRRGETFLYFGDRDPWEGTPPPRLPKLVRGAEGVTGAAEFFFDAVWFTRYCVVITDPSMAIRLRDYLLLRHRTRAAARKTVNVVWNFDFPPDKELLTLCRAANFKCVICADTL